MREILFRGKRKDKGEWVYGSLLKQAGEYISKDEVAPIEFWICGMRGEMALIAPETVGQYTGLDDKNGKGIFEGDIILLCEHDGTKTVQKAAPIYFGEYIDADSVFDNYRCIGFYVKTSDGCGTIGALLDDEFECEVIGNIYDNPELLEGDKT